jgi:predicted ATPase/type II secretory pathway predicted ATPase ExeA
LSVITKRTAMTSSQPATDTYRLTTAVVGRDVELMQLHGWLENALRGKRQVVFITGEAGIGKTTLVDAFLARIRDRADVHITSGQCVEQYGPGEAYLPLLEATARLCRAQGGERRIAALRRYAPSWLAQLPSLLEPQEFARLQQHAQGASRERMLREMTEAAELFATRRGLVMVLEDLHWSDVSTLDWVTYMARRREPARLLILGTYRPADVRAANHPLHGMVQELRARGQCEELQLAPLAEEAIAEYLTRRLNADGETPRIAPLQLTPLLHHRTGGNPLFLVNMVDDLIRQGVFVEETGQQTLRADVMKTIGEGIPDTLRQLIERQLERLPEPERRLLEVASVAGVEFAAAEVAAGWQTDAEEIESRCDQLAHTGQWLRVAGTAAWPDGTISGRYSFLHAVRHEVVYAQVAEARRVQLHRSIAARKEMAYGERVGEIAAELATHFVEGRYYHKAVQYLHQAGKNAVRRSAHQEAVAHFTRGLDLLATFPDTLERKQYELGLQAALGVPLLRTKGYAAPEVAHAYGRARELCQQLGEQPELFTALAGLCSFYLVRAELQTARGLAEQCLRLAQRAQDSALLVEAHFILGVTLFYSGELMAAHAILEQGRVLYDPQTHSSLTLIYGQDPGVGCGSYASLASWFLGYPDQALGKSLDTLSWARELSHPFSVGAALQTAAWVRQYRQEENAVQAHAEEELVLSEEEGFALWLAVGMIQRGWALSEQGDRGKGLEQMHKGLNALNATGAKLSQPYHLALLAQAYGKDGQPHEGLTLLDQALAAVDKTGERYYEAESYRLKGELQLQQWSATSGQLPVTNSPTPHLQPLTPNPQFEAEQCFQKALATARQQQAKSLELRAAVSLAKLWRQQNKGDEARELLEEIYRWFTEGFDTKDLQDAATLLRELGGRIEATRNRQQGEEENQRTRPIVQDSTFEIQRFEQIPTPHSPFLDTQLSAPSPQSLPSPTPSPQSLTPSLFRCEGEYWTLSFAGVTCRLKEARGLHYIAHLLQHPHQDFHVLTLISARAGLSEKTSEAPSFQDPSISFDHVEGFSDAGEVLDSQARAAYKQRLAELREELAEAQTFHDLGRSEQLTAEIDFLTHELTRAFGLGGRARRVGAPAERARVNITRAIKIALRKIVEHHPALGQHLASTIKTGAYCSYTPDVRLPITWQG